MRSEKELLDRLLREVDPGFARVLQRIPLGIGVRGEWEDYLPPEWLHLEMIERSKLLSHTHIHEGMTLLEIGSGPHALATIPLAYRVGDTGRIIAVDHQRWTYFEEILTAAGLEKRVIPLSVDARQLPFPYACCDLAVIIHGVRSLKRRENIIRILGEMFRVAERIIIAESLPIAKNEMQEAHLEMYLLRQEVFEAVTGEKDDIAYFTLEELEEMILQAGGRIEEARVIDIPLPHYLAFLPRSYLRKIPDRRKREELLERWEKAYEKIRTHGEEHPPVGMITARRGEA